MKLKDDGIWVKFIRFHIYPHMCSQEQHPLGRMRKLNTSILNIYVVEELDVFLSFQDKTLKV